MVGPTGEKKVFDEIWERRDHESFISGIQLDQFVPTYYFNLFAHLLSKNKYPKFRLEKANIALLTPREHQLLDHGTEEDRQKYAEMIKDKYGVTVEWEKLYTIQRELKIIYNDMHLSKIYKKPL